MAAFSMGTIRPLSRSRERVGVRAGARTTSPASERGQELARDGALELAGERVAARDRCVERVLRRFLAGERRLDLLGPDVAHLHHVAEAQAPRVLGGLLVGEFE